MDIGWAIVATQLVLFGFQIRAMRNRQDTIPWMLAIVFLALVNVAIH